MDEPFDRSDDDDILNLIADIHGTAQPQQQALDKALKVLETGHRHASATMLRFERTGRTGPQIEANPAATPSLSLIPATVPAVDATQNQPVVIAQPTQRRESMPQAVAATQAPPVDEAERTQASLQPASTTVEAPEVLKGQGAEFVDLGHTKTHIVYPKKWLKK